MDDFVNRDNSLLLFLEMNLILLGLVIYFFVVLVVGFFTHRYMKTLDDFLIGGRRLGPFIIAFSERASGESAWFILGLPGFAYSVGMSVYWTIIGIALGIFLSWTLVAKRLRKLCGEYGALTIPDYLESRFEDRTKILRVISTLIILLFYLIYLGAQFIGAGKILNATFGLNELIGMVIGSSLVVIYTVLGGFTAVAITDLIQGLIMLFSVLFIPILAIANIGGISQLIGEINDPNFLSITGGKAGRDLILGMVIGGMSVGLGYFGQPHLLTRYIAIRSPEKVREGVLIAMVWVLLAYWFCGFIGITGKVMFTDLQDREKLMPLMALELFPPLLSGIMISGAIAAMMSTADSQLLVVSSAIVEDIYRRILGRELPQRRFVIISRVVTIMVGVVAFMMALYAKKLIYWLVLYAWAGLGASFGPVILLSLYSNKVNKHGAIFGLIFGTLVTILWYNIKPLKELVYELFPAFLVSFVITYLVSLLTSKKKVN